MVSTSISGPSSDHDGVAVRIASPDALVRIKHPRRVYLLPRYATEAASQVLSNFFAVTHSQLDAAMARVTGVERQARAAAMWWEVAKVHLHTSYLAFKRASRRKSKSGYRQRLDRLEKSFPKLR